MSDLKAEAGRINRADTEAEKAWEETVNWTVHADFAQMSAALIAIAAELRAQRIAQRPGQ